MTAINNDYAGRTFVPPQLMLKPKLRQISDLPPEEQKAIRARLADDKARIEDHHRKMEEMEWNFQALQNSPGVQSRHAPNVNSLTRKQALYQIEYMSNLIQSGDDKVPFSSGNGTQVTTNYRQYVYWVQQHLKALDGAGQSTLAQA